MCPKIPNNVYVGYFHFQDDGGDVYVAFPQDGRSFKAASTDVLENARIFAEENPGVPALVMLRKGDVANVANQQNIQILFGDVRPKDVHVCTVHVDEQGRSTVVPVAEPKKSRPKPQTEKTFIGCCTIGTTAFYLPVPATGYMKARELLLCLAASFQEESPAQAATFTIRNQVVEAGHTVEAYVHIPCTKSECVCQLVMSKTGRTIAKYPNEFNPRFRPNQAVKDRDVFVGQRVESLAKELRAWIARSPRG